MSATQKMLGFLVMLVLGIFAGGIVGWIAKPTSWVAQKQQTVAASEADEFLQQALAAETDPGDGSARRAELLRVAAFRIQREQPLAARHLWDTLRASLPQPETQNNLQREALRTALSQLIVFQDVLEETLPQATSTTAFNDVWEVRQAVEKEIIPLRKAILARVQTKIHELSQPSQSADLGHANEAAKKLVAFATDCEPDMVLLVATLPTDGSDQLVAELLKPEQSLRQLAQQALKKAKSDVEAYRKNLIDDDAAPVDPFHPLDQGKTAAFGKCEVWLLQLSQLNDALAEADTEVWQQARRATESRQAKPTSLTGEPKTTGESNKDSPPVTIESLQTSIRQLQFVAYNLWALRELNAAEESGNWDGRLSQIDQGLLESAVSALYSSVQARSVEELKDPGKRSQVVQHLLSAERTRLSSF